MKFISTIFFLSALTALSSNAGNDNTPAGGRSSAMGTASVAVNDFWSVHNNQAGIAGFTAMAAGIYFESPYLIKELRRSSGAIVIPSHPGVFGVTYNNTGSALYHESKLGLAFARSFGNNFSAGIQLDYLNTRLSESYGSHAAFTFEGGMQARINKKLVVGVHVFNPLNVKLSDETGEYIPAIIRLGAGYNFSEALLLTGEIEKNIDLKARIKSGAEYQVTKQAFIRAGITTNPVTYTFGFGLELKNLKIDLSSTVHQVLGYSPQVSLSYYF
jgi:hypothetical protein